MNNLSHHILAFMTGLTLGNTYMIVSYIKYDANLTSDILKSILQLQKYLIVKDKEIAPESFKLTTEQKLS